MKGQMNIAQWLYSINPDVAIDTRLIFTDIIERCCIEGNHEMLKWIYELNVNTRSILLKIYQMILGNRIKENKDLIKVVKWIFDMNDNLYPDIDIEFDGNDELIHCRINKGNIELRRVMKNNKLNELYEKADIKTNDDDCPSCLSNDNTKYIQLDCGHILCLECYIYHSTCIMGCNINYNKINLLKVEDK